MKNKQDKAQILSETLDHVDDGMLQQALDTDTAEKFRALQRKKLVFKDTDRPVSNLRRYATAAACLIFAVGLAFVVGSFAKNFPALFPDPTEPSVPPLTQPPGTTITTEPTVPTTSQPDPTQTSIPTPTDVPPTEPCDPAYVPNMLISCGNQSVLPIYPSYEWTYVEGEYSVQLSADYVSPLSSHLADTIPHLTAPGITATLQFQDQPDSRMVRCWPIELQGNESAYDQYEIVTISNGQIQLKQGTYIYEITADWYPLGSSYGKVYYIFVATCDQKAAAIQKDFTVCIGEHTITDAYECVVSQNIYDNATGNWMNTSELDGYSTLLWNTSVVHIPEATLTGDVQIITSTNGTLEKLLAYRRLNDGNIELALVNATPADLAQLEEGSYYVIARVNWQGRYIESQGAYETCQSEYLFALQIPDRGEPELQWEFDESTGTLRVFGLEQIPDYTEHTKTERPWYSIRSQVTHLVIDDGTKRIGNFAFHDMENLQSVALPEGLEEIGEYAFCDAFRLAALALPDSLRLIDKSAFRNCVLLETLTLPTSIETIAHQAFQGCTALQEVTILGSPSVVNMAFSDCSALKLIRFCGNLPAADAYYSLYPTQAICYYPLDNKSWSDAFFAEQNYTILWAASTNPMGEAIPTDSLSGPCGRFTRWNLTDGVLTISGTGEWSHARWADVRDQIQKVVIENGITTIASEAFIYCVNLKEVSIPNSVRQIGGNAFRGCTGLTSITLPKNLAAIDAYAFYDCSALAQIVIPDSVTSIADYTFWGCKKLSNVTLPKALTQIGYGAFNGCTALTEITFPATLTRLGDAAFSGCTGLKKIFFLGDPPSVSNFTFRNVNATAYYPPENGKWADGGLGYHGGQILEKPNQEPSDRCGDNLTWQYADGVLTISGSGAMYEYSSRNAPPWADLAAEVTKILLPEGLTNISRSAFLGFTKITEITIPDNVTFIGGSAFNGCTSLTSIEISKNVHTIGEFAFNGCTSLETVTIGPGVTLIDSLAFLQCSSLKEIHFLGNMPDLSMDPFAGLTITIYYPAGNSTWDISKVSTYETNITWVAVESTP